MRRLLLGLGCALALSGCPVDDDPDAGEMDAGPTGPGPATALADYASFSFYAAPWPDERLRDADGAVRIGAFPTARNAEIVDQLIDILDGAPGFAVSGGAFFPLDAPIDPSSLPGDVHASLDDDASVYIVDVDPASPDRGTRFPITARFDPDPGPHGAPNLLALLPFQGHPLREDRLYAAVVTTRVRAMDGSALGVAPAITSILGGTRPDGLSEAAFASHRSAVEALGDDAGEVAAMAVFRTWDPTAGLRAAREQLLRGDAVAIDAAPALTDTFDDYCVYRTTVRMPDFQGGAPPYLDVGGAWVEDAGGLVEQREAEAALWITVPRRAMPDSGFPTAVFVRTGGGGDRPLVDRGPRGEDGAVITPGTGLAVDLARAGWIGVSVDGPLGGLRNTNDWDEQFAIFNIQNPPALRDSVRQSALELMHVTRTLEGLSFVPLDCPDFESTDGAARLDTSALTIIGHSMGATIAPLAVALEPRFRAMILSGAGASWIQNVMFKESPVSVLPLAESLVNYAPRGRSLNAHDPVLTLLQWAGEPADPQVYAREIIAAPPGSPRHVLMFQGILDTYIPPPVANALALTLGVDLAGGALDERLDRYEPLTPLLDLSGGSTIALPATGNLAGDVTAVVVQHEEDGVEDGHEVMFQLRAPRRQVECFLETLAAGGAPTVVARNAAGCE